MLTHLKNSKYLFTITEGNPFDIPGCNIHSISWQCTHHGEEYQIYGSGSYILDALYCFVSFHFSSNCFPAQTAT